MTMVLSDFEVARLNAGLYLVPAKTSPLFYLKSSGGTDASMENFMFISALTARGFRAVDRNKYYHGKTMNSVIFKIDCTIEKGKELFAHSNVVQA